MLTPQSTLHQIQIHTHLYTGRLGLSTSGHIDEQVEAGIERNRLVLTLTLLKLKT